MRKLASGYLISVLTLFSLAGCGGSSYAPAAPPPPPPLSNDATLADLSVSAAEFDQLFTPTIYSYTATSPPLASSTTVSATLNDSTASMTVNSVELLPGATSESIPLVVGPNTITVTVTAEDGVTVQNYTIDIGRQDSSGLEQRTYIKSPATGDDDRFGHSIAMSGNTLVITATYEDSAATGIDGDPTDDSALNAGAAYVFVRDNTNSWSQQSYLKTFNTDVGDNLGFSVALSGNTLAIGTFREDSAAVGIDGDGTDNSAADSGAVYIFTRDNTDAWSQEAYIKASNTDQSDAFGVSVSLSGDTLAVGAIRESSSASGVNGDQTDNSMLFAGAVYIFQRDAIGTWTQQAYLKASNPDVDDQFGYSVSLSDDTLAVGAYHERSNATGIDGDQTDNSLNTAGAVYIFERDETETWSQSSYLKASNTGSQDSFGWSVALSGSTLAVSAPYEDSAATGIDGDQADNSSSNAGAVYVFTKNSSDIWSQQAYIKASTSDIGDSLGLSLTLNGDFLAVYAYDDSAATGIDGDQADNSSNNSGAVYLYERDDGGVWSQKNYIKASNTDASDLFGLAIAIEGTTLAIGAMFEDSAATGVDADQSDNSTNNAGAVYLFQ